MISWSVTFIAIALVTMLLGFGGISAAASSVAWILLVVGVVFALALGLIGGQPTAD